MKICAAQMMIAAIVFGVSAAHDNYAQLLERKVTLELHDVSLVTGLKEIEKVAGIKIYYSIEQIRVNNTISLEANEQPLQSVLDELLSPLNIKYRVDEKKVAIFLKRIAEGKQDSTDASASPINRRDKRMEHTVTGTVTEATTQQSMAGVNVIVKGSTVGTTTDAEGKYSLLTESNSTLVFSFIGYKAIEVDVASRTIIDIAMEEDISSLNEVVVYSTGYSEESPERTTGSFSSIGKELLERNVGPDLVSRLNGVTPSLLIDQRGNQTFFSIRGRSTILANDQPLIVVDNFPYNGDINTINPNDIESITVLRDAAAASIWGVRAGNGVIVITTKRGTQKKPLQISMNSNITIGQKPDLYYENKMTSRDFITVEKMLFENNFFDTNINDPGQPPLSPVVEILLKERNGEMSESEVAQQLESLSDKDVRKDLEKYFYQSSINQQYSLNLNGGSEKHSYYLSSSLDKNLSSQIGNDYNRAVLNSQYSFFPIERLEVNAGVVYTRTKTEVDNTVSTIRMDGGRDMYPYAELADNNGNPIPVVHDYRFGFAEAAEGLGFLNWQFNPIEEASFTDHTTSQTNTRITAGINYDILKTLSLNIKYQNERQSSDNRNLQSVESYSTRNQINRFSTFDGTTVSRVIPEGDILSLSNSDLNSNNGRIQLNYNNAWKLHSLTALAGFEIREIQTEGYSTRFYGYDPNLGSSFPINYNEYYQIYPSNSYSTIDGFTSVSGTIDRFRSFFANGAYNFDDKYTVNVSGRIDQSNLFGVNANQRSAPLWSLGGRWSISKEGFYTIDWMPTLHVKASYGFNGNIDTGATALTTATFIQGVFSGRNGAFIQTPPNANLTWEKSKMVNLGIHFATRNNILSGSIEFYKKEGINLFGFSPLDPTSGLRNFKGNVASMQGHGWDIELNTINTSNALKWNTSFFFSFTTDKVTQYDALPPSVGDYFVDGSLSRQSFSYTPTVGKPLFGIYSYRWAGLDSQTGNPMTYIEGAPSTNYSALSGFSVDSLVYHGRATPPIYGAIRNTLKYRQWSLSFNIVYRFGYFFRRSSISYNDLYNSYRGHGDFELRWQNPGDELITSVPSQVYPANSNRDIFYLRSEPLVERGDNIRFQDIQLSYELNNVGIGKMSFRQLQVYSYLNNIGMLWTANKLNLDPDYPTMPLPRTIALGVRISL